MYQDQIALILFLTIFTYCIIPLGIALFRGNYIVKKKYTRACYGFNAILLVLFIILGGGNSGAYFIWTTVSCEVGKKILKNKGLLKDSDEVKTAKSFDASNSLQSNGETKRKESSESNVLHKEEGSMPVLTEENIIVDRSQEYLVCPCCATRQLSNRAVCYNCGVRFSDR